MAGSVLIAMSLPQSRRCQEDFPPQRTRGPVSKVFAGCEVFLPTGKVTTPAATARMKERNHHCQMFLREPKTSNGCVDRPRRAVYLGQRSPKMGQGSPNALSWLGHHCWRSHCFPKYWVEAESTSCLYVKISSMTSKDESPAHSGCCVNAMGP